MSINKTKMQMSIPVFIYFWNSTKLEMYSQINDSYCKKKIILMNTIIILDSNSDGKLVFKIVLFITVHGVYGKYE